MPDPTPPSDETLAEALRLYRDERLTQAEIGRRLGVSQPTVSEYVRKARERERYIEMHDRAEERGWTAESYRAMEAHVTDLIGKSESVAEANAVLGTWIKVTKARRELLGLDAPTNARLAITADVTTRNGNGRDYSGNFDRGLADSLSLLDEMDKTDTALIRSGKPGLIEQGVDQRNFNEWKARQDGRI